MKRTIFSGVLLLTLCLSGKEVTFPLEWNRTYDTAVPYEVEIDRKRLAEISGTAEDTNFEVTAIADGKRIPLKTVLYKGALKNTTSLQFTVPAGTTALECKAVGKGELSEIPESRNLFSGVLSGKSVKNWKCNRGVTVKATPDGMLFHSNRPGEFSAYCDVDVPAECAGKPVRLELDLKSDTPIPWSNINAIEQLDANGKVLPECAVRMDWISHMRPYGVLSKFRENGRLRPDVKKLRFTVRLRCIKRKYGLDGLPLKKPAESCEPKLEISRLVLRCAGELPFPKYDDRFFGEGVSGKPGDFSLKLSDGDAFFHPTASQTVWGDTRQVRDPKEFFFPIGDGTIEFFLKPDDWKYVAPKTHVVLVNTWNAHGLKGGRSVPPRNNLFELRYMPNEKKLGIMIKDAKDKSVYREAAAEIPAGKWNHVAAQWSKNGGVQLFVNGKKVMDDKKWSCAPIDISKESHPNAIVPMQVTFGCLSTRSRGDNRYSRIQQPDYKGLIDNIRSSDVVRYQGDFEPVVSPAVDRDTRSFFSFDRSFDGTSGYGHRFINGSTRSKYARCDRYIVFDGKDKKAYYPTAINPDNDPAKVLDPVNYKVLPRPEDFRSARKVVRKVFETGVGKSFEFDAPDKLYMDYIEITNHPGGAGMYYPLVVNEGEIDPRSFADIRNSLQLDKLSGRERVEKLFRFVMGASDYFMNHQADFPAQSNTPVSVEYLSLSMLNGYCGFECGPLNELVANLFTSCGDAPARLIGSYAHCFEGVHYDNKTRVYDLSAQKFFPSFDNSTAATLDEIDDNAGLLPRVGSNPGHFIRLTTRGGAYLNNPSIQAKTGIILNPRESFRIYFSNDGAGNDLQYEPRAGNGVEKWDYTAKTGAEKNIRPVWKVDRFFPHYANAFIIFNGAPSSTNNAFVNIKPYSFCYRVYSGYPIVAAAYKAVDKDGKSVDLEYSTDNGKTFKPIVSDSDGAGKLVYEVRARHEVLIRVNAPIAKVKNFRGETELMMNPRIITGKLRPGKNRLTLKSQSGRRARVTIQYRVDAKPIVIDGGVYTGTIPGFERQTVAVEPDKSLKLPVTGVTANAQVKVYGALKAGLKDGVLEITPEKGKLPRFETLEIIDGEAKKQLNVIVGKNIRFVTAKEMTPGRRAKFLKQDDGSVQDRVMINDGAEFIARFPKLPAGKYTIWTVNRFDSRLAPHGLVRRPLRMVIGGKEIPAGSAINPATDFYKAQYGKAGERGRYKWDFPLRDDARYPYMRPLVNTMPEFSEVKFRSDYHIKGIEVAAVLIVPEPSTEFQNEMMKNLCGLNYAPEFIRQENSKIKKY